MSEKEENPHKIDTKDLEKLTGTEYSVYDSARTFYFKDKDSRIVTKRVYYSNGGPDTVRWSYYSGVLSSEELKEVAPKCFGSVTQFEECQFLGIPEKAIILFKLAQKFGELGAYGRAKDCLEDMFPIFKKLYREQKDIIIERYLKPSLQADGCLDNMLFISQTLPAEQQGIFLEEMVRPSLATQEDRLFCLT